MNYEAMTDFEINCKVAEAHGYEVAVSTIAGKSVASLKCWCPDESSENGGFHYTASLPPYCNDPSDAWPIIVENWISLHSISSHDLSIGEYEFSGEWEATGVLTDNGFYYRESEGFCVQDENPLRAAMIVYLMIKDGES